MSARPSPDYAEKVEFWRRCATDFPFFCERLLRVRTKRRGQWVYVPYRLRRAQRELLRVILEDEDAGRPTRILVLKSRKLGISTFVQAFGYWRCAFTDGWKTQTYAHKRDATDEIASISVDFALKLAELFPFASRRIGASKKDGGLRWSNGSTLRVFTQRSDGSSRGSSPSLLHLSEVAYWEDGRKATDAERPLQAALGSLEEGSDVDDEEDDHGGEALTGPEEGDPRGDWERQVKRLEADNNAGTIVIIETTANGARGVFHARWQRAVSQGERSPWRALFFPWQTSEKHQYRLKDGDREMMASLAAMPPAERIEAWADYVAGIPGGKGCEREWAERAVEYELTPPQVRWAVQKADGNLPQFDQEFPLSADHAFLSTGRRVVPETVTRLIVEPEVPRPIRCGLLGEPDETTDTPAGMLASMRTPGDELTIWALPEWTHEHRYLVVTDSSGGVGADNACARVFDRVLRREVAELYANTVGPDVLADQAVLLGKLYGGPKRPAMIAPEINNHGTGTAVRLRHVGYPSVYRRAPKAPATGQNARAPNADEAWLSQFGWLTSVSTRSTILVEFVRVLRTLLKDAPEWVWHSQHLRTELETFVETKSGKYDHEPGKHSDSIITAAIGLAVEATMPAPALIPKPLPTVVPLGGPLRYHQPPKEQKGGRSRWFGTR